MPGDPQPIIPCSSNTLRRRSAPYRSRRRNCRVTSPCTSENSMLRRCRSPNQRGKGNLSKARRVPVPISFHSHPIPFHCILSYHTVPVSFHFISYSVVLCCVALR
ncbi:hypothetical protein BU24DRAFT_150564 [Aaosphaeria arxii CBS 175.79]|uniref:Uncharacterized protein n=1 Tax=Aaosphaeria arxii CBS 175.79 TaxID=1450172 RepID=A0A6A5XX10_9PLEO|nr:uncharacterized protein BU24DRAFT_150564 [Aaosphaeria arxii CBS 175.79]KAF2017433.1 hypothetical protein BU24DRAFT_150564 [Aaosphaeria arxii CBS 175.79]